MGKRTTPPRSFNTIRQSQCDQRAKRATKKRFVFLAICAIAILIVLSSLVLLICSIVDMIAANAPGSHNPANVVYQAYTQSEEDLERGELILINADHAYSFPKNATSALLDMREELESVTEEPPYGFRSETAKYLFNAQALTAFNSMMRKYYEVTDDDTLIIQTAYRSKEQQPTSSSIKPGHSDHHSGYCIAFTDTFAANESTTWIKENCYKYGFVVRYPEKKGDITGIEYNYEECFRYVGIAHATYMTENELCLEEYIKLLSESHPFDGDHLRVTGADGNEYSIYYVPLSNSPVTTLNVPQNFAYTVSGDNNGGFIVTVNLSDPIE